MDTKGKVEGTVKVDNENECDKTPVITKMRMYRKFAYGQRKVIKLCLLLLLLIENGLRVQYICTLPP